MVTRILLGLLGILFTLQAATAGTAEAALRATAANLDAHMGDFGNLDGKPGDMAALNGLWAATQGYVAERLNRNIPPKDIGRQAPPLNRFYGGLKVVPIGQDLYAVSANAGRLGNVFVVGKDQGRFRPLWDIRRSEMGDTAWGWNSEAARGRCLRCRAASGTVYALPPDVHGAARFYVDALYAQDAGATMGAQLSIWRFDGRNARALLKKNYIVVADDENGREDKASLIRRHDKHDYRMMFACGSCLGRSMVWSINVTADGVQDLGETPDIPEADVVDEVFFQLWYGRDASALAAPKALEQMAAIVAEVKKGKYDPKYPTLGMLMSVKAGRNAGRTKLTFDTDVDAAPEMVATVLHKKNGYYLENFEFSLGK